MHFHGKNWLLSIVKIEKSREVGKFGSKKRLEYTFCFFPLNMRLFCQIHSPSLE